MRYIYELWEFRGRSLVGAYTSEEEALATVRDLLASGWSPHDLALGVERMPRKAARQGPAPLTGEELAARARQPERKEGSA